MKKILTNPEWMQNNPTRVHMLRRRYGTLTPLHERLLSFGGAFALVLSAELDDENILSRGRLFGTKRLRMDLGRDSRCHENVAALYAAKSNIQICYGYGLSPDGLWRQHSWALDRRVIIETTERRVLYFGYVLNDTEAARYCFAHQRYMEAPCAQCGRDFSFDPDLVPNLRVSLRKGKLVPDPRGIEAPICADCIAETNEVRAARGLELIVVRPGAYRPKVSPEGSVPRNRDTQRKKLRRG
jgi:hypothetical protein